MIRIGLPKGGLLEKSLSMVELLLNSNVNKKQLHFKNEQYDIFLVKHRDIPRMINDNLLDCGITSTEWLFENGIQTNIVKELDWCDTRISLIISLEKQEIFAKGLYTKKEIKCVTEFPNIAKRYFETLNINHSLYTISGSSEACVHTLFDCCVDCVETGRTLKENNLLEYKTIMKSKIVFISKLDELSVAKILSLLDCV